jgi:hypothetical protein
MRRQLRALVQLVANELVMLWRRLSIVDLFGLILIVMVVGMLMEAWQQP